MVVPTQWNLPGWINARGRDNAFVTLANGQVLEIKLSEGAIVKTLNIGEPLKGDPLIQGGILYASGADGTLYAVGLN